MNQWLGVQRKCYNDTVYYLNTADSKKHWMAFAKEYLNTLPDYCKGVPYQIKKMAIKEAYNSFISNIKKVKVTGKPFTLRFKTKKSPINSCYIPKSAIKDKGIYPRLLGAMKITETLPVGVLDSVLSKQSGRWFLCIPHKAQTTLSENQGKVVAIDPGIRSFITFFSEDSFGHIGYHDFGRIVRLCKHLDDLISKSAKVKKKQRRAMKRASKHMRWKIKDLISEIHNKSVKFLVDNFDVIFLPKFETQEMSCKFKRKLEKKTVRSMLTYSFYKFQQKLANKCFELGKTLHIVSEAYTSKINSFTGKSMNIGSKESFVESGIRINRDINGARNILCFSLVDTPYIRNNIANINNC